MLSRITILSGIFAVSATLAQADFAKVTQKAEFMELVAGKTLTLPLVKLRVMENGQIRGKGSRWSVTGNWTWKDGYFCRDIFWGGEEIGYNCQEVRANGDRLRFTSDRGSGQSAVFRLRQD